MSIVEILRSTKGIRESIIVFLQDQEARKAAAAAQAKALGATDAQIAPLLAAEPHHADAIADAIVENP